MAASGRPEDTEILFQHIELVTTKMEQLNGLFGQGSEFVKVFDQGEGKSWVKYVTNYQAALQQKQALPSAPSGSSMKQWLNQLFPKMKNITAMIKYICQWCSLTIFQLDMAIQKVSEFDIRWNQYMTTSLCSLFVHLVKVVIYINRYPILKRYALMIPLAPSDEVAGTNKKDFSRCIEFMNECSTNPFTYLNKKLASIKGKMARLTSIIGTFIAKLFGTFPLIEWEPFSIFTKRTSPPESTLPSDEFLILQNIVLFKETVFFFLFVFPDTTKSNECFSLIVEALLSESPQIPITRTIRIPLTEFLKIQPNDVFHQTLLDASLLQTNRKFNTSHMQRILRVTFLLKDVLHVCEFNTSLLPSLMNHITALGALAYYELDTYFMFTETRNEAFDLLCVLLDLAKLISNNVEFLQRFFIFNLATVDAQFLAKQLSPAVMQTTYGQNEVNISKLVGDLLSSILALDLDQFDKGIRYDFTALLTSHARYLSKFCELKTRERISFLDPIFEHLTSIRLHIAFATSPIDAFLGFVPIHKMWGYVPQFLSIIRNNEVRVGNLPYLLDIFTYFSYDTRVLRQLPGEIASMTKRFSDTRGAIYLRLADGLSQRIGADSPHVRIAQQSHSFSISGFNTKEFATPHGAIKRELVVKQTKSISEVVEMKKFFERIPQTVILFKSVDQTAAYFAKSLTENLAKYLFSEGSAPGFPQLDMSFAAAAQFIWPLFSALGYSFQRRLFECRLLESSFAGTVNYSSQVDMLLGKSSADDGPITAHRLIVKMENKFKEFLESCSRTALYLRPLRGFWNSTSSSDDASSFFSSNALHYMVSNLGIHAGVRIDRVLTDQITKSISNIFKTYVELNPQLKTWHEEFEKSGVLNKDIMQSTKLTSATQEFQSLGIALQLRSLLRDELATLVDGTVPGLRNLVDAAVRRAKDLKPQEILIREIFCGNTPEMPFIRARLEESKVVKQTESVLFFFFFGILFMSPKFATAKYDPAHDAITENLHLFPTAIGAILRVSDIFFQDLAKDNSLTRTNGIKVMFSVLATIVANKRSQSQLDSALALTVLSNMFPSAIPWVEYGLIETYFPTRSLNHAYSVAAKTFQQRPITPK